MARKGTPVKHMMPIFANPQYACGVVRQPWLKQTNRLKFVTCLGCLAKHGERREGAKARSAGLL